jgi:hypothetical protein
MSKLNDMSTDAEIFAVAKEFADAHGLKAEGIFAPFVHPLSLIHEAGLDEQFDAWVKAD